VQIIEPGAANGPPAWGLEPGELLRRAGFEFTDFVCLKFRKRFQLLDGAIAQNPTCWPTGLGASGKCPHRELIDPAKEGIVETASEPP